MELLLIEDDKRLSDSICDGLSGLYQVRQVFDGEEGYYWAGQGIFDCVILDIMLPGMDGLTVLERLRADGVETPILMLTAKDTIDNKIEGFRKGADDYLVKPFHREELLLRLEAILRRTGGAGFRGGQLHFGGLTLNIASHEADIDGGRLELQGKQFDLLEYLINNQGIIVTKEQIFSRIWGFDSETTTNVVEVYCSKLRGELKKHGYDKYLKTIRGMGYMLTDAGDSDE